MDHSHLFAASSSSESLSTPLEISVSARHLKDLDRWTKSDPMCILLQAPKGSSASGSPDFRTWKEIGRTEVVKNDLNPKWVQKFRIPYRFEEVQRLCFRVVDVDRKGTEFVFEDIGWLTVNLSEIVGSSGQRLVDRRLTDPDPKHRDGTGDFRGLLSLSAEETVENKEVLRLQLYATKLKKKDLFGKSDPYFVFSRMRDDNSWTAVFKSPVIMNNLNPVWPEVTIPMAQLCGNDDQRPLLLEVFDWNKKSSPSLIGQQKTTVAELTGSSRSVSLELKKEKPPGSGKWKGGRGVVGVRRAERERVHSFLDYVAGGCELNLMIGVDFTQSNGPVNLPSSLHYCQGTQQNEYERAIYQVGSILQDYDSDRQFPCYGFGGKLPDGTVSHCFPLNGSSSSAACDGVDGVISAYRHALYGVRLWGPTLFAPIIAAAAALAQSYARANGRGGQKYLILLMLTDGVISDMDRTIVEIVKASSLPLSIVIVGVGKEDFQAMEILDADEEKLHTMDGRMVAERDIVQFVPFRDFANAHPYKLAEHVLAEIPTQLVQYMRSKGIVPNPRVPVSAPPMEGAGNNYGGGEMSPPPAYAP